MTQPKSDLPTLIALSAFSFILATAIHEHGGHSLACVIQGGHITELGAFYVECEPTSLADLGNRLVALAGPLASLITGVLGMWFAGRAPRSNSPRQFFLWHFSTVNLMIASGYLLFSGFSGLGDFGTGASGLFFQVQPEWPFRVGLVVLGLLSYILVVLFSLREVDDFIGGEKLERVRRAQMFSLVSYLTGGIAAVLIGLLNPYGLIIVLISSVASSLGGTSALAWMMQLLDRNKASSQAPFLIARSWVWIGISAAFLLAYAVLLGPTLYF